MSNLADLTEKLRLKHDEKVILEQEIDDIKVWIELSGEICSTDGS